MDRASAPSVEDQSVMYALRSQPAPGAGHGRVLHVAWLWQIVPCVGYFVGCCGAWAAMMRG